MFYKIIKLVKINISKELACEIAERHAPAIMPVRDIAQNHLYQREHMIKDMYP